MWRGCGGWQVPARGCELIEAPGILVMPGIYDGVSSRLVEVAGFKAAAISAADRERKYGGGEQIAEIASSLRSSQ